MTEQTSPSPKSALVEALAEAVKADDRLSMFALLAGADDTTKIVELLARIEAKLDRLLENVKS